MLEQQEDELQHNIAEKASFVLFLHSPFCGTCHVAAQMTTVHQNLYPKIPFVKGNVNLLPEYVENYEVTSIPALHVWLEGEVVAKIYAFHSVSSLIARLDSRLRPFRSGEKGEK